MAESRAVWGIDIGQAGLKAMKLKYAEAADQVLAVAFDYVAHPKILSQPDAIPGELIAQALEKFLSRNDVKGDRVAISVPGQTALTRFIQLPPVEAGKVAEIVKYEARQQIPFALEDVCWQWQTLGGGSEEGGYMLEAEVGLFAMKRDQVMQHLQPFIDKQIEVDLVQIAPLAMYNFLAYDRLGVRSAEAAAGGDEHTILLDMGADSTTLVVSNGEKIWIRNLPIGGNHFTRALTKEMKLTFAKAEHLKLNATKSPDPRAVFQALRPVFNDYVSEIQRSIGYFSSVNRNAKIAKVVGVGNGFKLAGLQKFLQQNLQYDVERVESFQGLVGDTVLNAKLFDENILSFAVPYGLALQALDITRIHVDLLPEEIRTERMIRRKKPWACAAAATLLASMAFSATGYARVAKSVGTERFGTAIAKAEEVKSKVSADAATYSAAEARRDAIEIEMKALIRAREGKIQWAELHKAIAACLPRDAPGTFKENEITKRNRIKIYDFRAEKVPDVAVWYNGLNKGTKSFMRQEDLKNAPSGSGFIITMQLAHYHKTASGAEINYVREQFVDNLRKWFVEQTDGPIETALVRAIGITHPVITDSEPGGDEILFVLDRRQINFTNKGGDRFEDGASGNGTGTRGSSGLPMAPGGASGLPSAPGTAGSPGDSSGSGGQAYTPQPGLGGNGDGGDGGYMRGDSEVGGTEDSNRFGGGGGNQIADDNKLMAPLTRVTVTFVWQPQSPEKRELFSQLRRLTVKYRAVNEKKADKDKQKYSMQTAQKFVSARKWEDEAAQQWKKEKSNSGMTFQKFWESYWKAHKAEWPWNAEAEKEYALAPSQSWIKEPKPRDKMQDLTPELFNEFVKKHDGAMAPASGE